MTDFKTAPVVVRRATSRGRLARTWPPRAVASASLSAARAGDAEAARTLDVWTYRQLQCVVGQLVDRDDHARVADEDAILSIAMQRVDKGRASIVDPASYASWVSVVGRNAYLNYRRSRPRVRMVHETDLSYDAERHLEQSLDRRLLRSSLLEAIARLPAFLRVVAEMRLVEDRSYEDIATETGKNTPTVRSYVNKALDRLRTDHLLKRLLEESRY